jgi:hypothetical protein
MIDNDPAHAELVQTAQNLSRNARSPIARVMIFFIGHIAGWTLNVLAVKRYNEGNDTASKGIDVQDSLSFLFQRIAIQIHKTNVICPGIQADSLNLSG